MDSPGNRLCEASSRIPWILLALVFLFPSSRTTENSKMHSFNSFWTIYDPIERLELEDFMILNLTRHGSWSLINRFPDRTATAFPQYQDGATTSSETGSESDSGSRFVTLSTPTTQRLILSFNISSLYQKYLPVGFRSANFTQKAQLLLLREPSSSTIQWQKSIAALYIPCRGFESQTPTFSIQFRISELDRISTFISDELRLSSSSIGSAAKQHIDEVFAALRRFGPIIDSHVCSQIAAPFLPHHVDASSIESVSSEIVSGFTSSSESTGGSTGWVEGRGSSTGSRERRPHFGHVTTENTVADSLFVELRTDVQEVLTALLLTGAEILQLETAVKATPSDKKEEQNQMPLIDTENKLNSYYDSSYRHFGRPILRISITTAKCRKAFETPTGTVELCRTNVYCKSVCGKSYS